MSLLDRVQQRKADEAAPFGLQKPAAPAQPAQPQQQPSESSAPAAPPAGGDGAANRTSSPLLARSGLQQRTASGRTNALQERYEQLRSRVHQRLVEEMAEGDTSTSADAVTAKLSELVSEVAVEMGMTLTRQDKQRILETLVNDVLGLGPLEALLADPDVTEVMINGPKNIYVEQKGRIVKSPVTFESNYQLLQVIDRIVSTIGRRVDESSPMVDARLKDGSRVNVIIPPLALRGPTVTIRKFSKDPLTIQNLMEFGSVTQEMVDFMRACVRARLNLVVSGGTGS